MRLDSLQHANLADHCYDQNNEFSRLEKTKEPVIIDGVKYKILKHVDNASNGYQGTVYQHVESGAIVVAHRGTEPDREFFRDVGLADFGMVATRRNIQADDAVELTQWALEYATDPNNTKRYGHPSEVTVTGHSLGGSLAQITAHRFGLRGETFNAYGAVSLNRRIPEGGDAIINHVVAADVISSGSPHYGQVRVYAAQEHVAALQASGYGNDRQQVFDLRQPLPVLSKALDFHGMHNFRNVNSDNQPDVSLLRDPQAQQLAAAYDPMIDKYRADIGRTRAAATIGLRNHGGLVGDAAISLVRGDLTPGLPVQREADHRQSLPGHPLGERLRDNAHATPLPDHLLPGAPSRSKLELPDYSRPAPTVEHSAPLPNNAQATTPAMHASPLRSGPALTPQHHYIPPPPAEPAVPSPLPTTQTLEPGDRGAAVQALQQHLQLLGATDRYGQKIQDDRDYGDRTREAVAHFQSWNGREPTGIADPDTLKTVQSQAQFILRQRGQVQHDSPSPHNGPASRHEADPHAHSRSAAIEVPGRSWPERESEPEPQQPRPQRDAQAFPTGHRDYALFEAIRKQLPDEYSDDTAAHATLEAKRGGITRPDQIRGMAIEDGQLTIMGKSGVDFSFIELTASTPPLQETLQQSAAFDRQQAIQLAQFQEQQQQMNMGRGPSMTL